MLSYGKVQTAHFYLLQVKNIVIGSTKKSPVYNKPLLTL